MSSENNRKMPKPEPQEVPVESEAPVLEEKVEKVNNLKPSTKPPLPASTKRVADEKEGIKVMALRNGFYGSARRSEGDVFMVSDMSKLGSWMQCLDPKTEAEHQKKQLAKKKSIAES